MLAATLLAGCVGDIDPPWQLDHDRIVAVRATPPGVAAEGTSTIDALLAHDGGPATVEPPVVATVAPTMPPELMNTVVADGGGWKVVAPDEATLAMARQDMGMKAGDPVPLLVAVSYGDQSQPLVAVKTVILGTPIENPTLGAVTVDAHTPEPDEDIGVGSGSAVHNDLSIDEPEDATVNWFTSVGTLHDDDEHAAFIEFEKDDPLVGQLAVVIRTTDGGVAFQVWKIHAD
jgi:hypothetical protein